jgi:Protein of unknown function (DUF3489)
MIFTIDNDNDIRVHETEAEAEEAAKAAAGAIVVRSEKELNKAAAEWPASRLVEIWNSFAGVAPFTDCKPVKKFENRDKAVARIWAAIQRLGSGIAPKPPEDAEPTAPKANRSAKRAAKAGGKPNAKAKAKSAAKPKGKGRKAAAGKPREGTAKAEVIAMLQRKGGATLEEIMEATGWQKPPCAGLSASWGARAG